MTWRDAGCEEHQTVEEVQQSCGGTEKGGRNPASHKL